MNLGQLQTKLGSLLKVKTKRYPLEERTDNINQAIRDLDDEFGSWFSEETGDFKPEIGSDENAGAGEYDIATVFALEFVSPVDVYYLSSSDGSKVFLDQLTIEELTMKYPDDTDYGSPVAFAIYEEEIYLRPVPDAQYTLYWKYIAKRRKLEEPGDSNRWTTQEPYAVLYGAAVYGCVYLLEESRMGLFAGMAKKKVDNISIRQSNRMSASRPVSEEPGATQGV